MTRIPRPFPPVLGLLLGLACAPPGPALPPEEAVKVPGDGNVVVYVEAPRYLVAPVLKTFSEQTGITVQATYREQVAGEFLDTVRTAAAAGKADLFVSVSPLSAIALARADLAVPFRPLGARPIPTQYHDFGFRWIGFAVNPRVIIYNRDAVSREEAPQSIDELVEGRWAGKGALAGLAIGTSAFQAATLFAHWGDEKARAYFDSVQKAGNRIVSGDEEVRRLVAAGDVPWGIVDLDRAICAKRQADPINISFPDRLGIGAVMVPETVVLLKGAPDPAQARGLFAYLFATETAWQVGQNDCALMSLMPVVAMGIPKPDWVPVLGSVNILSLDNDLVYDAWIRNRDYLSAWGQAAAPH
ncbi:MAG TPA: extracellular solute-binding protein [Patescibacteria group bacterium]|nr:extracellular solute-binding protein [Patescibacteria group bacterium]